MVTFLNSFLVLGQVTSERLASVPIPPALRESVDSFKELLASLKAADTPIPTPPQPAAQPVAAGGGQPAVNAVTNRLLN